MEQMNGQFRWANEHEAFWVSDADIHYYACKYIGSSLGFVIDKDVFHRQLLKGRIQEYNAENIAV